MYYKVLSKGKAYYSKEIVKAYLHMGDDGIQREVISGQLSTCVIMDRVVYELPAKEHKEIDRQFSPVVQDLDAQLKAFYVPSDASAFYCGTKVGTDPKAPRFQYEGLTFIRFTAVRLHSRYREQTKLALIEVCGTKYVALNCFKDSTQSLYVA